MNRPGPLWRSLVALRDGAAALLGKCPGSSRSLGPPRHWIPDTTAWPAAAGGANAVRMLTPERTVRRSSPRQADPALAERLHDSGRIKARFVAELVHGRCWGRGYGYVIDADDALHGDLSPSFEDVTTGGGRRRHDGRRQPWLPRVRTEAGVVAVASTLFCENFHHWLLDAVPKFGLLREAGWELGRIDRFILPAGAQQAWHRETLARLGVPLAKVLWTTSQTHVEAERLIVPSYAEPGREPERYDYTPEGLALVRGLFLEAAPARSDWPDKIVVSRELASARRWRAGDVGHERLRREGFTVVVLERHSLAEQAGLFAHARQIVMPTGGGLANLAFCSPGTRVVELFDPGYVPTFSAVLGGALGLDYVGLVGVPAGAATHGDAGAATDIDVPVERVLAALT